MDSQPLQPAAARSKLLQSTPARSKSLQTVSNHPDLWKFQMTQLPLVKD